MVAAVIWVLSLVEAQADWRRLIAEWSVSGEETADARQQRWLREAQHSYLRGEWQQAEQPLLEMLRFDPRDLEARLQLATLRRHQGRRREAAVELDRLERMEAAVRWQWEINNERGRLQSANQAEARQSATPLATPAVAGRSQAARSEMGRPVLRHAEPPASPRGKRAVSEGQESEGQESESPHREASVTRRSRAA
jgi:tetratricopeptide (TPR) repeat protein